MATVTTAVRTVKTPVLPDEDDDFERAYEPTPRDWAEYRAHLEREQLEACDARNYYAPTPFSAWIEATAAALRSEGTERARWLADRIDDLATFAVYLHARDPQTFEERMAVIESRGGSL